MLWNNFDLKIFVKASNIHVTAVLSDKTITVSDVVKWLQIILKHVIKLYVKFWIERNKITFGLMMPFSWVNIMWRQKKSFKNQGRIIRNGCRINVF